MQGVFEMNIGKLGTQKNSNFFLGGGEHWWVWQGVGVTRGGLHEVGHTR